jgi:hypothetical protein
MFESNFPVDRWGADYADAVERLQTHHGGRLGGSEKAALFAGTAARFYRLEGSGMKALRYFGERDIRHDSMEDPKLESDRDAIVKMTACSICGSDLHIYHGHGFSEDTGFCVGHEAVGEVVEVGRASHGSRWATR